MSKTPCRCYVVSKNLLVREAYVSMSPCLNAPFGPRVSHGILVAGAVAVDVFRDPNILNACRAAVGSGTPRKGPPIWSLCHTELGLADSAMILMPILCSNCAPGWVRGQHGFRGQHVGSQREDVIEQVAHCIL